MDHKISKQVFSAGFKRKVLETRWKDKLSFKETAELFSLDNPRLITAWHKRYLDERIFWLQPKPKGRPPMKTKKEIKTHFVQELLWREYLMVKRGFPLLFLQKIQVQKK